MYIFVTGTDTDVGKSYISKGICSQLIQEGETTGYLKPFQSGTTEGVKIDAQIAEESGAKAVSSYVTKTPCAPLLSSKIAGVEYDLKKVVADYNDLKKTCENVIVEGSGGIYVPVKKGILMIDVIKMLNIPALVIARPNLGTVNHTLMTIDCLVNNDIKVLGAIISNYPDYTEDDSIIHAAELIEMFSGKIRVLDVIKENQTDFSNLVSQIRESIMDFSLS